MTLATKGVDQPSTSHQLPSQMEGRVGERRDFEQGEICMVKVRMMASWMKH